MENTNSGSGNFGNLPWENMSAEIKVKVPFFAGGDFEQPEAEKARLEKVIAEVSEAVNLSGVKANELFLQQPILQATPATDETPAKYEGRIQAECFQWFWNAYPQYRGLMYHVPNGGKMTGKQGNEKKAMGVVAGVPDLEFHYKRRTFFLECKTPGGKTSEAQDRIHTILADHGFQTWIFRNLEEFQKIVLAIIEDTSEYFNRGYDRARVDYRHAIFSYLYGLPEGEIKTVQELTDAPDKFKGVVFEFISDGYDRAEGFEILFTPDYLALYKKKIGSNIEVNYNGSNFIEIPK